MPNTPEAQNLTSTAEQLVAAINESLALDEETRADALAAIALLAMAVETNWQKYTTPKQSAQENLQESQKPDEIRDLLEKSRRGAKIDIPTLVGNLAELDFSSLHSSKKYHLSRIVSIILSREIARTLPENEENISEKVTTYISDLLESQNAPKAVRRFITSHTQPYHDLQHWQSRSKDDEPIEQLGLPPRILYALVRAGIKSLEDLESRLDSYFNNLSVERRIGKGSIAEITTALTRYRAAEQLSDSSV